jgi:cell wall-associated NlpC family hydrolase
MWREYVGIPFKLGGRDRGGCDCWGLVRLVLAERFQIELPSFDGLCNDAKESAKAIDSGRPMISNERVEHPEPGDIVMFRHTSHVGLCIEPGLMLHTGIAHDSVIERLCGPRIRKLIEGYYRCR